MIKIENVDVFGWDAAIRGMRNPKNSWDKSDSFLDYPDCESCLHNSGNCHVMSNSCFVAGENDLKLMKTLANAGPDHGKFLRYLIVQLDIDAPLYWWKEFKTYRKGRKFMDDGDEFLDPEEYEMFIETNSCSTMHKIHAKEFTMDDFSHEHNLYWGNLEHTIDALNHAREQYLLTKDKKYWYSMIQTLPSSYNQRRTVQLNYTVLKNMYHARRYHKLDEWRDFCEWIKTLPYSELITGESEHE